MGLGDAKSPHACSLNRPLTQQPASPQPPQPGGLMPGKGDRCDWPALAEELKKAAGNVQKAVFSRPILRRRLRRNDRSQIMMPINTANQVVKNNRP